MRDEDVLAEIGRIVRAEHEAREAAQRDELTPEQEQAEVERLEVALDRCWDLLRQRRARRAAGEDPDDAEARPEQVVERYRQ
ncbi:DUF2630 family protein [Aquipuribacter nitratireducens]|uniref:DUF2630 family protein n=1 Tax=Aquipuribacter nitratireducens TaxID=650104 RepID=A0ABW0GJD8_9MICO